VNRLIAGVLHCVLCAQLDVRESKPIPLNIVTQRYRNRASTRVSSAVVAAAVIELESVHHVAEGHSGRSQRAELFGFSI
jgi:hypothetical protein